MLLSKIQKELRVKDEVRAEVYSDMRKAIRLSKQSILFAHQERIDDAREMLKAVDSFFTKLHGLTMNHPDLIYSGLVDSAFQEYTEAHTFLTLIKEEKFVSHKKLGIPPVSYVLGLADVVGELRRRALDFLRREEVEKAEVCLELMEQIYVELTAMDDAYLLVPGLRRKCDIARRIIENTRGDITLEIRRDSLERAITRLERVMRSQKVGEFESKRDIKES